MYRCQNCFTAFPWPSRVSSWTPLRRQTPAASFLENLCTPPPSIPTRPLIGPPLVVDPPSHLTSADLVFVRRGAPGPPLLLLYDGPFRVVSRVPKTFTLQLGGRQEVVTVDSLKPCLVAEVTPAAPMSCGHPLRTT